MASYYASSLAPGGGTGTILSPFTFAEMIAYINASFINGDIAWIKNDGTYNIPAFVISKAPALAAPCTMEGYTTTPGDGGMAILQRTAGAAVFAALTPAHWIYKNLIFDANNLGTNAVTCGGVAYFINCVFRRAGSGGVNGGGAGAIFLNCKAEINATYGMASGKFLNCIAINNGTNGLYGDLLIWNCVVSNNGGYGVLITPAGGSVVNSVINGNTGGGINTPAATHGIINNIFTNHPNGHAIFFSGGGVAFCYNNNFFNNTSNSNVLGNLINSALIDPAFFNPSMFDFRRTTNVLSGLGYSFIGGANYETVPGIAPARIGSGTFPTFAGITGLVSNAEGTLLASWAPGANLDAYAIFIQANTAVGLFSDHSKIALMADDLQSQAVIKALPSGVLLDYNTTYHVGVRAENAFGEETNVVSLSAIPNNNVNVTIAALPTTVWAAPSRTLTSLGTLAVDTWNVLLSTITTVGSIGKLIKDYLDAAITSRLSTVGYTAPDNAGIAAIKADVEDVTTGLIPIKAAVVAIPTNPLLTTDPRITTLVNNTIQTLGLVQSNYRIKSPAYDASNNLTGATLRIYATAGDCDTDTAPIGEYLLTATYDLNNNLATYKVTKV